MSKAQTYTGEILEYGTAPYQHDPQNSNSFYVRLKDINGNEKDYWGVTLQSAVKDFNKGDDVVLINQGKSENGKANVWEMHPYETPKPLANSIEPASERTKLDKDVDSLIDLNKQKQADFLDGLPNSIKDKYYTTIVNKLLESQKVNFYNKANPNIIAFEDRDKSLHTQHEDKETIKDMLDMAQAKGWDSVKLSGTQNFKQATWLEANLRGIKTQGYEPTDKDLAMLEEARLALPTNQMNNSSKKQVDTVHDQQEKTESDNQIHVQQEERKEPIAPTNIAKDIAIETEVVAIAPAQPIVATTFLAQDAHIQQSAMQQEDEEYYLEPPLAIHADMTKREQEKQQEIQKIDARFSALPEATRDKILQDFQDQYEQYKAQNKGTYFTNRWEYAQNTIKEGESLVTWANGTFALDFDRAMSKNEIRQIAQDGYATGEIKNRDELIQKLEQNGYSLLDKEDDRLIVVTPVGKRLKLTDEIFAKDYQPTQPQPSRQLSQDEANLQAHFSKISEYKLNQDQLNSIETWRRYLEIKFADAPDFINAQKQALNEQIPNIANGSYELPQAPEVPQQVEINTLDQEKVR